MSLPVSVVRLIITLLCLLSIGFAPPVEAAGQTPVGAHARAAHTPEHGSHVYDLVGASTTTLDNPRSDAGSGERRSTDRSLSSASSSGAVVAPKVGGEGGIIFRGGSQTDNALTDKGTGLSFRDSLSNPIDGPPVLRPGEKYFGVDTSKLPKGSVVPDNVPPGHVGVRGLTPDQVRQAIVDPFGDPFLGGKFPKR